MTQPRSLNAGLKISGRQVREYVRALEAENEKLHRQIAKLEVKAKSLEHRIRALEQEFDDHRRSGTVKDLMADIARKGRPTLKSS